MTKSEIDPTPAAVALVTPAILLFPSLLVGALIVPMGKELAFGAFQLGVILCVFNVSGAVASQIIGGWIDDKGGRAGVILGAISVALSSAGIAVLAGHWVILAAFLFASGFGMTFAHPTANRLLARAVPRERQGLAFGIKQAILPIASAIAGLGTVMVDKGLNWRVMYVLAAAASLALILAARRIREDMPRSARAERVRLGQFTSLVMLSLAGLFSGGSVATFVGFVVHSSVARGMSPAAGGVILTASSLTAVTVRLVAGWLADRRTGGHLVRIALMLAVGAAGCIGAAWAPNDLGFILACVVIGGAGWGIAGLFHFAVIRIQPDAPGRASGVAQIGLFVGAAAGPVAFGYAAEFLTMTTAWMLMAAWMTLASGFVIAARAYLRPVAAAANGGR